MERLCKRYLRYRQPSDRALAWLSGGRFGRPDERSALEDVSFTLARGGSLGLCGRNGAGKSTLLRVLSGATQPSRGRYRIDGTLGSLIELGAGFHAEFSGVENALQQLLLSGCPRREAKARVGDVLEFAELGRAAHDPLRTYSSGMAMRLAFACAIGFDPDVLLLDEAFAVGDLYFQKKCVDRVLALKARGTSLVLCSHSLYDLRQLCEDGLWLEEGRVAALGACEDVTARYAAGVERASAASEAGDVPHDDAQPRIVAAELLSDERATRELASGASVEVTVEWENPHWPREGVQLGVGFVRSDRTLCAAVGTHLDGLCLRGARGRARLTLPRIALLAGRFQVRLWLFDESGVHRWHERALERELVITSRTREVGLVRLEHAWSLETASSIVEREVGARSVSTREVAA